MVSIHEAKIRKIILAWYGANHQTWNDFCRLATDVGLKVDDLRGRAMRVIQVLKKTQ